TTAERRFTMKPQLIITGRLPNIMKQAMRKRVNATVSLLTTTGKPPAAMARKHVVASPPWIPKNNAKSPAREERHRTETTAKTTRETRMRNPVSRASAAANPTGAATAGSAEAAPSNMPRPDVKEASPLMVSMRKRKKT